ncbi:uncharacterized protein LOC106080667 isoform X1 [Stomoxys calcitrans]|uniref:uncharacterized protein LOC106080667 isoform X1 n=2 Tax=Stomoxys calcitrans TaxID=35570 RepID=UPI0027E2D2B0|nr:uncharacterized protein LOC106080667 isoform X1 [Stomoxys calcitrans]
MGFSLVVVAVAAVVSVYKIWSCVGNACRNVESQHQAVHINSEASSSMPIASTSVAARREELYTRTYYRVLPPYANCPPANVNRSQTLSNRSNEIRHSSLPPHSITIVSNRVVGAVIGQSNNRIQTQKKSTNKIGRSTHPPSFAASTTGQHNTNVRVSIANSSQSNNRSKNVRTSAKTNVNGSQSLNNSNEFHQSSLHRLPPRSNTNAIVQLRDGTNISQCNNRIQTQRTSSNEVRRPTNPLSIAPSTIGRHNTNVRVSVANTSQSSNRSKNVRTSTRANTTVKDSNQRIKEIVILGDDDNDNGDYIAITYPPPLVDLCTPE